MSNKKQTAVDWLVEQLRNNENIRWRGTRLIELEDQAKEIEKQQIVDAYNQGRHNGQTNWGFGNDITAEQYYNETFNNENTNTTT